MYKLVLVETVSTFRHTYVVRLGIDEPNEYALDDVIAGMDNVDGGITDVTQNHIAEDIFSYRNITQAEYLEMFDRENAYLSGWPTEKKLEFIYDSLEKRAAKVHNEVNWGPDVGREILSEDC
jgi:hypothetical protein